MNGANMTRGLVLAISCLVLGFVGGWSVANLGGKTIALPDANLDVTVAKPNPVTSDETGQPSTGTASTAVDPKSLPILVLNASGVAGLAAKTKGLLTGKGYTSVSVDNGATVTGTTIYYADTAQAAATQLGTDLQVTRTAPLADSSIATAAAGAKLVVVLGK
jgi:hypothetical protein